MPLQVHNGTAWKNVTAIQVHNGTGWKTVTSIEVHNGTAWKSAYTSATSPTVSPRADGDSNFILDAGQPTCHQGCDFDSDGTEYENNYFGNRENATTWLDSGSASDVWVEFVYVSSTSGTTRWDSHASSTRFNCGTDVNFGMSVTAPPGGNAQKNITGYFRMWDAASGGNILWTGSTVQWSCSATDQTGPCSTC